MLGTSVKNLIQIPETGDVVGIKTENEGKEIYIKAEKEIILSCKGYENNSAMFDVP
jgi:hypothetical protein